MVELVEAEGIRTPRYYSHRGGKTFVRLSKRLLLQSSTRPHEILPRIFLFVKRQSLLYSIPAYRSSSQGGLPGEALPLFGGHTFTDVVFDGISSVVIPNNERM